MYFKLNSTSYYVTGKGDASIYDLKTGMIIEVPVNYINELTQLTNGLAIKENSVIYSYLKDLESRNLGYFHSNTLYQEGFRIGLPRNVSSFTNMKVRVFNLYLQIQDDCDLNCEFCRDDGLSNRMTGCKRYHNKVHTSTVCLMEKALAEASMLGCQNVHFLGGDPLLNYGVLMRLIDYARKLNYKDIYIYTNGRLLTKEMLSFFKCDVKLILHLVDFDPIFVDMMKLLMEYSIKYYFNICLYIGNYLNKENLFAFASSYTAIGYSTSYVFDNLDVLEYHNEIQNTLKREYIVTNENTFFNNMNHHPCLYGKITVFANGSIGVCPMIPNNTIGNIEVESISDVLIDKRQDPYWNKVLKNRQKCSECSLRFGCNDCFAIEQYIHLKEDEKYLCVLK